MPRPEPGVPRRARRPSESRGGVPRADAPPSGCRFHPRCPHAQAVCAEESPAVRAVAGRDVACLFAEALSHEGDDEHVAG
jgi:oligopeptide/dipeptide ABC transporter ATP-binding protein